MALDTRRGKDGERPIFLSGIPLRKIEVPVGEDVFLYVDRDI